MALNPSTEHLQLKKIDISKEWESLSDCWLEMEYLQSEPLYSTVFGADVVKEGAKEIIEVFSKVAQQYGNESSLQYVVWDKRANKIVGCLLSEITTREETNRANFRKDRPWNETSLSATVKHGLMAVGKPFMYLRKSCDYLEKFGVDKALVLHILCIKPEYRGKGLSELLINEMVKEAHELSLKLVVCLPANYYSQRVFHRVSFQTVTEIDTEKHFDNFYLLTEDQRKLHNKIKVVVKVLSADSMLR